MMNALRILEIMMVMTAVPLWVGTLFLPLEKKGARLPFCWISGQVLLWAGFQCICVPAILTERTFREIENVFFCYVGFLALLAGVFAGMRRRRARVGSSLRQEPQADSAVGRQVRQEDPAAVQQMQQEDPAAVQQMRQEPQADPAAVQRSQQEKSADPGEQTSSRRSRVCTGLWTVFALLLMLQLFLLCFLSYNEGDDAFYVAIATGVNPSGKMYVVHPYTGSTTGLDARHALAPLPMWVSMMSRISGLSGAATAHVALPLILVPMTYCLYYLLGKKLIGRESAGRDWSIPLFLCLTALLILFGGYSVFSAENFLLVRGAQGKSVLANLIIPFLIYEMFCVLEKLERGEKPGLPSWILIGAIMIAGCLCSTLGSLLVCMLLGISVACAGLVYRRWSVLACAALCMAAPVLFAGLYVVM